MLHRSWNRLWSQWGNDETIESWSSWNDWNTSNWKILKIVQKEICKTLCWGEIWRSLRLKVRSGFWQSYKFIELHRTSRSDVTAGFMTSFVPYFRFGFRYHFSKFPSSWQFQSCGRSTLHWCWPSQLKLLSYALPNSEPSLAFGPERKHRIVNSAASHNPNSLEKHTPSDSENKKSTRNWMFDVLFVGTFEKDLMFPHCFPHWHSVSFCSDFYVFVVFVSDPFGSFRPPWLWPWQLWRRRALSAMHSAWSSAFPTPDIERPRDRFEDFEVSATSQNDGHLLMTAFRAPYIFSVHHVIHRLFLTAVSNDWILVY